uniref:C2 domain-containing protein n=1 Tax=Aegilops tauschii subsp. strangulata TaxID=200361 RepID=A0A453FWN2_AEGTS
LASKRDLITARPGGNKEKAERPARRQRTEEVLVQVSSLDPEAMGRGVLEVHLVDAKGLFGSDFLGKIDPYVVVQYRSQERKSSTSRGQLPGFVFLFMIFAAANDDTPSWMLERSNQRPLTLAK